MPAWHFSQTQHTVLLGTASYTTTETFLSKYRLQKIGTHGNGEIKFEPTYNCRTSSRICYHRMNYGIAIKFKKLRRAGKLITDAPIELSSKAILESATSATHAKNLPVNKPDLPITNCQFSE